jgi:heme/copper-type cytochrome/quinol oxidase subunit 2
MDHGYMPIVVEVLEEDVYNEWLDRQKGSSNVAADGDVR